MMTHVWGMAGLSLDVWFWKSFKAGLNYPPHTDLPQNRHYILPHPEELVSRGRQVRAVLTRDGAPSAVHDRTIEIILTSHG
jgi:hypothetical protein